jgi:pimeloyl-ACP methyl ester carboxylesterase
MVDLPSIYPDLERNFTTTGSGSTICSYSKKIPRDGPIVVLIHGYPQSAYMWVLIPSMRTERLGMLICEQLAICMFGTLDMGWQD